jgi:fucose 4-O-acetylase-like acetyltransferase
MPKTSLLNGFLAVNYACGMALFFLISGYFHPSSFDKDGLLVFLKKRILKLGIPMGIYFVSVVPVIMYAYYLNFRNHGYMPFWEYYVRIYWAVNSHAPPGWTGPNWSDQQLLQMWFSEHLLIFGFIYAVWRLATGLFRKPKAVSLRSQEPLKPLHVHVCIVAYTLMLTVVYYVVRIKHPLYHWIGLFDAIQVEFARLPQRASLFVVGIIAYRRNWFGRLTKQAGYVWAAIASVLAFLVYTRISEKFLPFTAGGTGFNAFGYALLDALLGTSACVGLLVLFRERFNTPVRKLGRALARSVYCVYIIHMPVVVAIQYGLADVPWHPAILAGITAVLAIPISFAVSHFLILRLPGAKALL